MSPPPVAEPARPRAVWRAVAVPAEHGGWGLTLEPVLLGLLVAPSGAGVALGVAAFTAFLVRTPLKLVAVDRRRGQQRERTRLAARIAAAELVLIVAMITIALVAAGPAWLVPLAVAAPLVVVEAAFDVRSRSRRLLPELCGAAGIAAVAAAIAVAGGEPGRLAAGLWLVLAARAAGSIPYVRTQIVRLRRGGGPVRSSDLAQLGAGALAVAAWAADPRLLAGAVAVGVIAAVQLVGVRRPPVPAKTLGFRQMALGLALVAVTAAGVLVN